jgi:hypothetical protein
MSELAENPYAAPSVTAVTAPFEAGRGEILFEEYEAQIIRTMSKGMRITGVLEIVVAALLVLMIGGALLVASRLAMVRLGISLPSILGGPAIVMCAIAGVIALAAVWLLQSSKSFIWSLRDQRTDGLARGFQKLRLYLVVTGVFMILSTLLSLLGALAMGIIGRLS